MEKIKILPGVILFVLSFFILTTCDLEEFISTTAPHGVYVGLVSFDNHPNLPYNDLVSQAGASNTLSSLGRVGLVCLSSQQDVTSLNNVLDTKYNPSADTANTSKIYFSVNKVINNLKASENHLSDKLDNVTFVTFTRGYDQGSVETPDSEATQGMSGLAYGRTIQTKIRGNNQVTGAGQTLIRQKPINAYAVAIYGTDPTVNALQEETLSNITSGSSNEDKNYIYTLDKYSELNNIFQEIAGSLTSISFTSSLILTIDSPSTPADGDKFRATFDTFNGSNPESSNSWIEGRVVHAGDRWEIQPVQGESYITSSSNITFSPQLSKALQTSRQGSRHNFGLPGITVTGSFDMNNIRQFYYRLGNWVELTGANTWGSTRAQAEQKAAVIFLILDSTLSSSDIVNVQNAAKGFISTLYNMSRVQ